MTNNLSNTRVFEKHWHEYKLMRPDGTSIPLVAICGCIPGQPYANGGLRLLVDYGFGKTTAIVRVVVRENRNELEHLTNWHQIERARKGELVQPIWIPIGHLVPLTKHEQEALAEIIAG